MKFVYDYLAGQVNVNKDGNDFELNGIAWKIYYSKLSHYTRI